jgi:uncharacterized protein (TIGR02996 family)
MPMSDDRAAFLAAIIAAPKDDLPRLIYADWLDEHGEPARAEFIRVQCDLAKWTCNFKQTREQPGWFHDCGTDDKGYWLCQPLRGREQDLLEEHAGAWTDFLPEDVVTRECPACSEGGVVDPETGIIECRTCDCTGRIPDYDNVEFRRGFVEEITLPWQVFLERRSAIRAATPLRHVRLTVWPDVEVSFGPFPPRPERGETVPMCIANIRGFDKAKHVPHSERAAIEHLLPHTFPGLTFELLTQFEPDVYVRRVVRNSTRQ